MLSQIHWKQVFNQSFVILLVCVLILTGCGGGSNRERASRPMAPISATRPAKLPNNLTEVAPPDTLQALNQVLDRYQPQVKILSPQSGEVLETKQVSVQLQVKDLPIFKDADLGIGPHLDVVLDDQPSQLVYDLSQPLVLTDLAPGSHTLRVFASRPWHESFKNEGSFAQVTFHLFAPTTANNPSPSLPLLTYNAPSGTVGAEPVLLDFYLSNAPLRLASELAQSPNDWRIRCTVNGQSFTLDRWQPLYLMGFQPGKNWVRLELVNGQGQLIDNAFNDVIQVIDYQPNGQDTLSKLLRGDIKLAKAKSIILPGFKAIKEPEVVPAGPFPIVEAIPQPTATPVVEMPAITPVPTETPTVIVTPDAISPPEATPEASPVPQVSEKASVPAISPTSDQKGWGKFFSRSRPPQAASETPSVVLPPTPEATVAPTVSAPPVAVEVTPETTPTPEPSMVPEIEGSATPATEAPHKGWGNFFSRSRGTPTLEVTPQPTTAVDGSTVTSEPMVPALTPEIPTPVSTSTLFPPDVAPSESSDPAPTNLTSNVGSASPSPVPAKSFQIPGKASWNTFLNRLPGRSQADEKWVEPAPTSDVETNEADVSTAVNPMPPAGAASVESDSITEPSSPSPELMTEPLQPQASFGRLLRRRSSATSSP